ncbi:MAG TPA: SGNH/GDSL hydrolase family protein [Mucilaginibacter sp.]|jgi:lysophospholipase L1-like esterase|nr:SGNH/GDSL hydrolase family protein [Mucilaginibacter sp.]
MKAVAIVSLLAVLLLFSCKKEADKVAPDDQIGAWGDSLTFGQGCTDGESYPSDLQRLSNIKVMNYGISGQTSTQIRDRMLADPTHQQAMIIWAGRNNYGYAEQVKADIDAMVKKMGNKHYLILGITNGDEWNEWKGNPGYQSIISLNSDLATIYGDHFIDIRSYLVSNFDKTSQADSANLVNDVVPVSLRSDFLHLNDKGYQLVAQKIYEKIAILK